MDEQPHSIGVVPRGVPPEGTVIIRPRWWALPVAASSCLLFVTLGVVIVMSGGAGAVVLGLVTIAFFGGGLVVLLLRRPWDWSIVIDDSGVTWRRAGGETLVQWSDIAAVHVAEAGTAASAGPAFVTLKLRDPSAVDIPRLGALNGPLQKLNRRLVGGEASIGWNERDRPAAELAALLDRRLEAWRAADRKARPHGADTAPEHSPHDSDSKARS